MKTIKGRKALKHGNHGRSTSKHAEEGTLVRGGQS